MGIPHLAIAEAAQIRAPRQKGRFLKMPLEKDNPKDRDMSNKLDEKFKDSNVWNKGVRLAVHGVYHAGRFVTSKNPEEWARAKDQLGKIGTGQSQTDYLAQHRAEQQEQKKMQEVIMNSNHGKWGPFYK